MVGIITADSADSRLAATLVALHNTGQRNIVFPPECCVLGSEGRHLPMEGCMQLLKMFQQKPHGQREARHSSAYPRFMYIVIKKQFY